MSSQYKFELQPQFFVDYFQIARKSPGLKATTQPSFGLIDRPEYGDSDSEPDKKPWGRFTAYINRLNKESSENVSYKVLFLTRHGLGIHNVYERKVGRKAWDDHWSHLDGDGNVTWHDAKLTETGIQQTTQLGDFWKNAIRKKKVPLPETLYTSPLARCLETTRLVFSKPFEGSGNKTFKPVVKELLRERLTHHTCDARSSRSWIERHYPIYEIEDGFSGNDELWKAGLWESTEEHVERKQKVLEEIFEKDESQFVSLTLHSFAISAILRACGSEEFRVREGSTIAIFVRGEKIPKNDEPLYIN